jgi:hypothetical protein
VTGADRDVWRKSSGVDTLGVGSPPPTGLPGLLFTVEAGLALRSPTLVAATMSEGRGASPATAQVHNLLDMGCPNCVAVATAAGCCLSHSCNL